MSTRNVTVSKVGQEAQTVQLSGTTLIAEEAGFTYNIASNKIVSDFPQGAEVNMPEGMGAVYGTRSEVESAGYDFSWYDENA